MIEKLREKVVKVVAEIEAVYPEYQDKREEILKNQDLVAGGKRRQQIEMFEAMKAKVEDLHQQGQAEIHDYSDLINRQITQAKKIADDTKVDSAHRAQVESMREELEAELIAVGPVQFLREIGSLIKEGGSVIRLEAARAILPALKFSLYEELHNRLSGQGGLNPWEVEKEKEVKGAISPENQGLIKAELQDIAKRLSFALKPERLKKLENQLADVSELESEVNSARFSTARLLAKIKPIGPEPGSTWDSEVLSETASRQQPFD